MHHYTQGHPKDPGSPRQRPRCQAHGRNIDGTSTEQSTEHRRNNGTSTEHRRNIDGTSNNLRTRPAPNPGRAGPRRHRKGPKATTTQTEKQILRFRRNAPHPPSGLRVIITTPCAWPARPRNGGMRAPGPPGGRGFGTESNPKPYGPGPQKICNALARIFYTHLYAPLRTIRIIRTMRRAFGCFFEPRPCELFFLA